LGSVCRFKSLPPIVRHIAFRQFDLSLKDKNPEYGVRDLESVVSAANEQGLNLMEVIEMPANNLSVLFRKEQQ